MAAANAVPKLKPGDVYGGHTYMGGDPHEQQNWLDEDAISRGGLTGQPLLDVLQKQNPAVARMVQAFSEGRQSVPKNRLGTDPFWMAAFRMAQQYDPTLDEASYPARQKTRMDFTSGTSAQNIRNLNQAIGHLHDMTQAAPGVSGQGGSFFGGGLLGLAHAVNWAKNSVGQGEGDPNITAYEAPRTALASELASVFKGKGTSNEAEVSKLYDLLSINNSTAQKYQAARSLSSLLKSRLDELADQYNQGMGTTKDSLHFLNPNAQKQYGILQGIGEDGSLPQQAASAAAPNGVDPVTAALLRKHGVQGY